MDEFTEIWRKLAWYDKAFLAAHSIIIVANNRINKKISRWQQRLIKAYDILLRWKINNRARSFRQ